MVHLTATQWAKTFGKVDSIAEQFDGLDESERLAVIAEVVARNVTAALEFDDPRQAAKLLGITRATLRKRIEKHGIQQQFSTR